MEAYAQPKTIDDLLAEARRRLVRLDPREASDVLRDGRERQLILVCDEGYQSSLAAATLHELGLTRTTDLAGGFQAWRAAGLPVER